MISFYQDNENGESTWIEFEESQLEEIKQTAYHIGCLYLSHNPRTNSNKPVLYKGDLTLEIDHKPQGDETKNDAIKRSITDLQTLKSYFEEIGLNPNACKWYLSGGKGGHCVIPKKALSANAGYEKMPLIHKYIASVIAYNADIKGMDYQIYAMGMGHLIRVENKPRSNGFYKVPITPDELNDLTPEKYFELCSTPRPAAPIEPPTVNKFLSNLFQEAINNSAKPQQEAAIIGAERLHLAQCREPLKNGTYTGAGCTHKNGLTFARLNPNDAEISAFAANNGTKNSKPAEIENHLKAARAIVGGKFSCGYVRGLDNHKMAICSGCPLNDANANQFELSELSENWTELKPVKGKWNSGAVELAKSELKKGTSGILINLSGIKYKKERYYAVLASHILGNNCKVQWGDNDEPKAPPASLYGKLKELSGNAPAGMVTEKIFPRFIKWTESHLLSEFDVDGVITKLAELLEPSEINDKQKELLFLRAITTLQNKKVELIEKAKKLHFANSSDFDLTLDVSDFGGDIKKAVKYVKELHPNRAINACLTYPMSGGKTQDIKANFDDCNEAVCHISPTITITQNVKSELGLLHYDDDKQEISASVSKFLQGKKQNDYLRIATTTNSLYKVDSVPFKIVAVDECEQVRASILTAPYFDRPAFTFASIRKVVTGADIAIFADAQMNSKTAAWIRGMDESRLMVQVVKSKLKHKAERNLILLRNHKATIQAAIDNIKSGGNSWVACTTKLDTLTTETALIESAETNSVKNALVSAGLNENEVLVIHGGNSKEPKQQAFLNNPNVEGLQYKCVITSPSMTSGFSMTQPHFNNTYVLNSQQLPAKDVMQLAMRNRPAENIFMSFKDNRFNPEERLEKLIAGKLSQVASTHENFNAVSRSGIVKNSYYDETEEKLHRKKSFIHLGLTSVELLAVQELARTNADITNFKQSLVALAIASGWTVDFSQIQDKPKSSLKLSQSKKAAQTKAATAVTAAADIDDATAEELSNKSSLTIAQSNSLKKHHAEKFTNETASVETVEFLEFKRGYNKVKNFEAAFLLFQDSGKSLAKIGNNALIPCNHLSSNEDLKISRSKLTLHKIFKSVLETVKDSVNHETATKACEILRAESGALAVNGWRYRYEYTPKQPVKVLGDFLQELGLYLVEDGKRNKDRIYKIEIDENVKHIALNRFKEASKERKELIKKLVKNSQGTG